MSRLRIGAIGNTDIIIHPSLLIFTIYAVITGYGTFASFSMVSVWLHEIAHAIVTALNGERPHALELTPLGAVMRIEDESEIPLFRHILIIIAGPATSLVICWLSLLICKQGYISGSYGYPLFICNLAILLINILPVLPLDGGRLLHLILKRIIPVKTVNEVMKIGGTVIGILLILLNIYVSWHMEGWNLSLSLAGCCIIHGSRVAVTSRALDELRQLMKRKILLERKGKLKGEIVLAMAHQPACSLVKTLRPTKLTCYVCLEPGTMNVLGFISEFALVQQYMENTSIRLSEALLFKNKK